jgi:D-3-phosphoglycerate dehydrogenase
MVMERPSLTAAHIDAAPRLRIACRFGAGYDNLDVAALTRRGIPLATSGGANADTVAEHALYLMLALAKRGPVLDRAVKAGLWPRSIGGIELRDRICLIIGFGRIGRQIARRAAAFAMRIVVVDPNAAESNVEHEGYTLAPSLAEALPAADFVVLACASNAETRGLINRVTLKLMRRSAFLVNIARGAIVEEAALAAALESGEIAGAGLDVLAIEPPPRDHPLVGRDDVVLTPPTPAPRSRPRSSAWRSRRPRTRSPGSRGGWSQTP